MKNGNKTFVNMGVSSLIMVFLVLCLVIFAALSLMAARSDQQYSQRMAQHRTEYYEACNRAEVFLAAVDAGNDPESLGAQCADGRITWQTPLNDSQALSLELTLTPENSRTYVVESYKIITTTEPGGGEPLQLIPIGGE